MDLKDFTGKRGHKKVNMYALLLTEITSLPDKL